MANPFIARRTPKTPTGGRPGMLSGLQPRSLAASAMTVNIGDRPAIKKMLEIRQSWQGEAWAYRRNVGELRYADTYLANSCMRLRLHPATYEPGDPEPVELTQDNAAEAGIPADLAVAAAAVMLRLAAGGPTAMAQLQKKLTSCFEIAGEGYLVCVKDPVSGLENWSMKSTDELKFNQDGRVYLCERPGVLNVRDMTELLPGMSLVQRLWWPDPQWSDMADSPVRAQLDTLEELLLLSRDVRATARSRLANNGFVFIPSELTVATSQPTPDTQTSEADKFAAELMRAGTAALTDEGSAAAVFPIMLRGPQAAGEGIRFIPFERAQNKFNIAQRAELIGRLATGLDLPAEVLTGKADLNHWSAWQVDDDSFRHHIEPMAVVEVDALTAGFLWPQLDAMGQWPADIVRKVLIWYDPTALVTHPDRAGDAMQVFDRGGMGRDALRKYTGFGDDDAPDQVDAALYILKNSRGVPPPLISTLLKEVARDLDFPAVEEPGVHDAPAPAEPDEAEPAPGPPAADDSAPAPTPPAGAQAIQMDLYRRAAAARRAFTAAAPPPAPATPARQTAASRKLVDIDRDLRVRLQTAANAAVRRVLEQAGARIVSKSRTAAGTPIRDAIKDVPKALIAATIGPRVVAALGITEAELRDTAFSELKKQWDAWIKDGQQQALRAAAKIAGVDINTATTQLAGTFADDADEGWAWLQKRLDATVAKWLTTAPTEDVEIETTDFVSTGIVRAALAVAGGFGNDSQSAGLSDAGQPVDKSERLGGIGTGDTIGEFLTDNGSQQPGAETALYTWVHGGTDKPFLPHEALDGVEFSSWDDPVLANDGDFPDDDTFYPGDHDGCTCDFYVIYSGSDESSSSDDGAGDAGTGDAPDDSAVAAGGALA